MAGYDERRFLARLVLCQFGFGGVQLCLEGFIVHLEQYLAGFNHGAFLVFTLVEKTLYP